MPEQQVIARAAERASVGGGYPYEIAVVRRRTDDMGWVVSFVDVAEPAAGPVFDVEIDDDASEDQTVERILAKIRQHQGRDTHDTES